MLSSNVLFEESNFDIQYFIRCPHILFFALAKVLPDKVFRREGADIYVDVPVPFTQV